MQKIITNDGSVTFYNEQFDDIYHSKSGAYEESLHKFVMPCRELFVKNELFVLDICFGLGYNSSVLLDEVIKINPFCKIHIVGLENDKKIIEKINEVDFKSGSYLIIKEAAKGSVPKVTSIKSKCYNSEEASALRGGAPYGNAAHSIICSEHFEAGDSSDNEIWDRATAKEKSKEKFYDRTNINYNKNNIKSNIKIKLLIGDARKTIKELKYQFDIVFLDPFAPKKCPELWTNEFIFDIANLMTTGGILTTYSCARNVRENLESAGLKVFDGPCIGRRAPSTIARKD